jgi:hypothetical protein
MKIGKGMHQEIKNDTEIAVECQEENSSNLMN